MVIPTLSAPRAPLATVFVEEYHDLLNVSTHSWSVYGYVNANFVRHVVIRRAADLPLTRHVARTYSAVIRSRDDDRNGSSFGCLTTGK